MSRRAALLCRLGLTMGAACAPAEQTPASVAPDTLVWLAESEPEMQWDTMVVAPMAAGPPRPLFAFERYPHEVGLDPIAMVHGDTLRPPPFDQSAADGGEFGATWYAPGTRYPARSRGVPVGWLEVLGPREPGCTGLPGAARWAAGADTSGVRRGVAFAADLPVADFRATATARVDSLARAAAREALRRAGVSDTLLAAIEWDTTLSFLDERGVRSAVHAASVLTDSVEWSRTSTLVVVARLPAGPAVTLDLTQAGVGEVDVAMPSLFDVVDLDGDRVPELVVYTGYYESWDYSLYRRAGERWRRIYRGGGGGC